MPIDFSKLWQKIIAGVAHREHSVHGPDHWRRVERNACILCTQTGANVEVVRLFALFHDSCRVNDGHDPEHGSRGAEFAQQVWGVDFELAEPEFELLHYACTWHTDGLHHDDPTIGTCWDADRLDLGRVGMIPNARYMSTNFAREIANHGLISPYVHLADQYLK